MSPSLEYLERCAAETGFQVTPLEKVVRLGEMAADLARRRGYRVQQSADAFAGRKLYLRYRSTLGPEVQ